jgi:hypothetical protein
MPTERSGYEIRENLLQLAHRIVETNAHMSYSASKRIVADDKGVSNEVGTWTGFTAEDVIATARKLNEFVSQK